MSVKTKEEVLELVRKKELKKSSLIFPQVLIMEIIQFQMRVTRYLMVLMEI